MSINRRDFLKTVVVAAGSVGTHWASRVAADLDETDRRSDRHFPQSVCSGDPKPESVILWTRVVDPQAPGSDLSLRLQVSTSRLFLQRNLVVDTDVEALEQNDGCVRVKVTGLEPRTYYYYRFVYTTDRGREVSTPRGRTKTAPAPDDAVDVRFALASCQDYVGKYYNTYLALLEEEYDDLDFLLHVGDFIYETTGDPSFQDGSAGRAISFDDEAGAIRFGDPDAPDFLAARSVSNYRNLYRTYRSDPVLKEVLEKFPLVHVWDDHEFTDDSWGDSSTYGAGLGLLPDGESVIVGDGSENVLEQDRERKLNSEQVFYEYIPIDNADDDTNGDIIGENDTYYPRTTIYRALRFGARVNLIITDYRTRRPDHPIPEDLFPGAVLYPEDKIRAKYRQLGMDFDADTRQFVSRTGVPAQTGNPAGLREYTPWRNEPEGRESKLDAAQRGALRIQVRDDYIASGYSPDAATAKAEEDLAGNLDIEYLNRLINRYNRSNDESVQAIELNSQIRVGGNKNPYGLSAYNLNHILLANEVGARYALNADYYELWRALAADDAGGVPADEDAYGARQERFIRRRLDPDADWNIVVSSVSSSSIVIDLDNADNLPDGRLPDSGPGEPNERVEQFRRLMLLVLRVLGLGSRFYVTCDQWDGMPNRRYELHQQYRAMGNVLLVSGDIHSSWVNDFSVDGEGPLFEFTGTSISSATFSGVIGGAVGGAESSVKRMRMAAPFAGFVEAIRAVFEQGAVTIDPESLEAMGLIGEEGPEREALKGLLTDLFGRSILGPGERINDFLAAFIEQLLSVLDGYFFALKHESAFLRTRRGSKIKSDLGESSAPRLNTDANGIVIVDVSADGVLGNYKLLPYAQVGNSFYDDRATAVEWMRNEQRRFWIDKGTMTLAELD